MPTPAETISEYFAALRAMDVDRWLATFAPNATSHDPVGTPPHHGHEALRTFLSGALSLVTSFGLTENNVFLIGNKAAVKWTGNATGKNGKSITFEGVDVIEVDDSGKIILVHAYWNPAPLFTAIQN